MRTLNLSQPAVPPLCLQPLLMDTTPDPGAWVIVLKKKRYALGADLVARAAALSVDALRSGGLVLIGLHQVDVEIFAPGGFNLEWVKGFRALLDLILDQHRARTEAAHEERATRWMSGERPLIEEGRDILRELAQLAQAGSVRGGLDFVAADLQSLSGVRDALWEATAKLRVRGFREAILKRGMDEARIRRLPKLSEELLHQQAEELVAQGRQAGAGDELLAWKAMALGDLTMLSSTARALLPQERWEPYQIGRLLGQSRAADRREDRPAPPAPPTDRPAPADPATPGPVAGLSWTPTPATAATPPTATAPATAATPTSATAPTTPATPAPPRLPPGTVLHSATGPDGTPWVLLVAADGTPRWTPVAAPTTTTQPQPATHAATAQPLPAPVVAPAPASPAAAAKRKGRRTGRR